MALFDLFKKKPPDLSTAAVLKSEEKNIPDSEKKYYQPDSYYKPVSHENTVFEQKVITFEERKTTSIPSSKGLYVAEILLLHFCGSYPQSKNGYPGYWWYTYGIRDVGARLESLAERGFIVLDSVKGKYELTELGKQELQENEYVPYMHKHHKFTDFTIWDLNLLLGNSDKSNYQAIIEQKHTELTAKAQKHHDETMKQSKLHDPEMYEILSSQDAQYQSIMNADAKYASDGDIDSLIGFWEGIWNNGGLLFRGSKWTFYLPDLYIKTKQYDKAISLCKKIKKQTEYKEKADSYIEKIEKMNSKEARKK